MPSLIPSQPLATGEKPLAEVVVEGELSPFEHEALYRLLRKSFKVEQPSYRELSDEDLAARVNVVFHYPYSRTIFTDVLQENWRDLKELFKQITYRRGRAGAAFTLTFVAPEIRLIFKSGPLGEKELGSALDQIGHLTAIVAQMLRPDKMDKPIEKVETTYDKRSDRWHEFQASSSAGEKYVFDETLARWVPAVK
ncbi:MAG TPA: hypothetical protein VF906_02385 [Candidatus Bathyarchaeia archaeon]